VPVAGRESPHGARRVAGHMSWQGMSMLVQALAQFGVTAALARLLAPEDFGLIAAANIAVTFVQVIAEGGIGSAIVQRKELDASFISAAMSLALMVGLACYLLLVVCAFPFQSFFSMDRLALVLLVLGLSSLLSGTCGVLEGLLQRDLQFHSLFRVTLVTSVAGYAAPALILALAGAGVWSLVAAALGRVAVKLAMLLILAPGPAKLSWDTAAIRDIARFGFGLTQDRFWLWVAAQSAPFLIGRFFGQALLGQFYMGSQLAVLPAQYLSTVVSAVYFPMVSRALPDRARVGFQFMALIVSAFLLMTAFGLVLAINAEFVISAVYGDGWSGAVLVFEVLCIGAGIRAGTQICDALNIARGDVYALAGRRTVSAGIMVLAVYAARGYGLHEVSWAVTASQAAMFAMTVVLAARGLGLRWHSFKPFLSRTIACVVLSLAFNALLVSFREHELSSDISLLALSVVANAISLLPVLLSAASWLNGTGLRSTESERVVGGG
jgi:O-antigen/teichoic acid export membrane protein